MSDAPVISEALKSFLGEVFPVAVATRRRNGSIHLNPVWFEYDDGYLWLNSYRGAKWLERVERDGDLALLFIDPKDMFRTAEVQARLVESTADEGDKHINRLSHRYLGTDYPRLGQQQRVRLQLEPTKVRASM